MELWELWELYTDGEREYYYTLSEYNVMSTLWSRRLVGAEFEENH